MVDFDAFSACVCVFVGVYNEIVASVLNTPRSVENQKKGVIGALQDALMALVHSQDTPHNKE